MSDSRVAVIIPARMGSTRFPGKPLVPILGMPMIEHVRRRASLAQGVAEVWVATCDSEVRDTVEQYGGRVVMTSPSHERGTDRVAEAARELEAGIIVNVQGDEPLLNPASVEAVAEPLQRSAMLVCSNLVSPLAGLEDLHDPTIVKATVDQQWFILHFGRWVKPHTLPPQGYPVFRQTGIAAFRHSFLTQYEGLAQTPLERVESVDLWRVLENGFRIQAVKHAEPTIGVDHPEDVARVEDVLRRDARQRGIYDRIAHHTPAIS